MRKARFAAADDSVRSSSYHPHKHRPCIFEEILSDHIYDKILQERVKYDEALVRANRLLQSTRQLRTQVRQLSDDYSGLESHMQRLAGLNSQFKRAARERLDYLERETFLASLIAYLMAQHRHKDFLVPLTLSPRDWGRLNLAPEPRHKWKRRILSRFLCGNNSDRE